MKPGILLIGKNGQVGSELWRILPAVGNLTALGHGDLDLTRPDDIRKVIRAERPNLIINAAAYTAVDQAEKDSSTAFAVNAEAPAVMAAEAKSIEALLVHYSTDYVFSGAKNSPYVEDDPTNPQNVYGRTKLEGEEAIRKSGAAYLIFRTAWVYAHEGRNFLLTILRLATEREELRIVQDQIGAPTWSRRIAEATTRVLHGIFSRSLICGSNSDVSGVYHMTAAGQTDWFEFAQEILDEATRCAPQNPWFATATKGRPLIVKRVIPITSAEYPTPASRPPFSVLSNARLNRAFHVQLEDWRMQLRSLFRADKAGN